MQFIDLKKQYQSYRQQIDEAMQRVFDHGRFILGPEVAALEAQLAEYVGVDHCVCCASGTDALLMSLLALDIGPGDEVITTPFTFISTAQVVQLRGAVPVFVDIDPTTFCLNPEQLESAITPRTRAILPVSLFGQMANYPRINEIAHRHGIPVIEDGAQSFGATQLGRKSCSVTTLATTSFYPVKALGCYGDGGAVFTNDAQLAHKLRAIHVHGGIERHHYDHLGMNSRLDTLQAAVLQVKLTHFEQEVGQRQHLAERYNRHLKEVYAIPLAAPGNTHLFVPYTIRCGNREEVQASLDAARVPYSVYYPHCLHQQPAFSYLGYREGSLPVAEQAATEVLSLPMHAWLTESEQDEVIEAVTMTCKVLVS